MDTGAIFLLLALFVLVGLFLYRPFAMRIRRRSSQNPALSTLLAEHDRVLATIQELDFDQIVGKIPAEEYPAQRAALLQRGADILRQIDEVQGTVASAPANPVEAAIASRLGAAPTQATGVIMDDDDIEAMISRRRTARKEKAGGFCPACGRPALQSDRFCPHCGKPLV